MSQPRAKRHFAAAAADPAQRPITAFFTPSSPAAAAASASTTAARGSGSGIGPALPAAVQSSLLSVGMRVRKAVPEGYKTLHGKSAVVAPVVAPAAPAKRLISPPAYAYAALAPYCGINKIGGLAAQPQVQAQSQSQMLDLPPLSSSQETIDVAMSGDDDDEDNNDEATAAAAAAAVWEHQRENKKRSFVAVADIAGTAAAGRMDPARGPEVTIVYPERVMAVPRKARPAATIIDDNDFEEATFLVDME